MDAQAEKKITIDQVAKLCGVSKTTISRYLNGKFENISAETRENIRQVIEELDYRPNRSAQRLKASRSMLIGCTIGDVSSPFSGLLLKGITRVCEAAGYQVLFADSAEDPKRERNAIQGFLQNQVDGLIVNSPGGNDMLLIETQERGVPIVLADRGLMQEGRLDTVASTDRQSAFDSVSFLLNCGYTKVAFFSEGNRQITPRLLRCRGYIEAVEKICPQDAAPIIYEFDKSDPDSCRRCVVDFRSRFPDELIAILSVNGTTTPHILLAFQAEGLSLGWYYGLCTFDDWTWLRLAPPGITSVALNTEQIGEEAARLLLERISGKRPQDAPAVYMEIPTKLNVRGSTLK